jgi:hypothetical protein
MTLAKELNEKLDEIIEMRKELARMNAELDDNATLTNIQTGEPQTKADAIELIEDLIKDIYKQINQISNNGNNVTDIFTNKFYVNDFMQDREIVNRNKERTNTKAPNNSNKKSIKYPLTSKEYSNEEIKEKYLEWVKKRKKDRRNKGDYPF